MTCKTRINSKIPKFYYNKLYKVAQQSQGQDTNYTIIYRIGSLAAGQYQFNTFTFNNIMHSVSQYSSINTFQNKRL